MEDLKISITTQGDTGTASQVEVKSDILTQLGRDLVLRAKVCNDGTFANSTNATLAPVSNKGATLKSHTSNKDIDVRSPQGVAATQTLTISGVVIDGETVTIGDHVYEFDTDAVTTQGRRIVDISGSATASEGSLTIDEQPAVDDDFTIGSITYTFKAVQSINTEIAIGATLAATQANVVARINGTDQFRAQKHPLVTAAAFDSDVSVITARKPGTAGDAIATTENFSDVATAQVETITCVADSSDSLDGTYFQLNDDVGSVGVWIDTDDSGTTIPAGASALDRALEVTGIATDDTAEDVATAIATIIDGDSKFSASADAGVVTVTHASTGARTAGSDGDAGFTFAVTTTGRAAGNNEFDAATLGTTTAGVDCPASAAVTALVAAVTGNADSLVSAEDGTGDTVDISADATGTSANSIATTETMANGSWGAATMSGGIDSTPGVIVLAVTDATAETVTLRFGPPEFNGADFDFSATDIDITHESA